MSTIDDTCRSLLLHWCSKRVKFSTLSNVYLPKEQVSKDSSGWWQLKYFFMFTPIWGRWSHFDQYFSQGLKPTSLLRWFLFVGFGGAKTFKSWRTSSCGAWRPAMTLRAWRLGTGGDVWRVNIDAINARLAYQVNIICRIMDWKEQWNALTWCFYPT